MHRFNCDSNLWVKCLAGDIPGEKQITVSVRHRDSHVQYYDVSLPSGAVGMIQEGLEWSTPVAMVGKIQAVYPTVTAGQIHSAWTEMSKILWKRAELQLPSAKILLKEFTDDVDVLDVHPADGVEQLCFAMKRILEPLRGKVVEIGLDATYGTNSKHLKLYTVLGEYDNAGFPLSYCLLSTTGADDLGKRKRALEAWARVLRDKYGVIPVFIHVEKDMAEIGMAKDVRNAKIQLCWWHLRKVVRTRLQQSKLSTTPYNLHRAHGEFAFINLGFKPQGRADAAEYEGGFLESIVAASTQPNSSAVQTDTLRIKLPAAPPHATALTDVTDIPSTANSTAPDDRMDLDDEDDTTTRRTFCPAELREPVMGLAPSPVDDRTVVSLDVITHFVLAAEHFDSKGAGVQGNMIANPKDTIGRPGHFYLALRDCKIVAFMTKAACALLESTHDGSAAAVNKCLMILGPLLVNEQGHRYLQTALSTGFLRVLVFGAQLDDQPDIQNSLNVFLLVLSSSLIYHGAFRRSYMYQEWQEFTSLAQDRIGVLKAFDEQRPSSQKACDNLECGIIGPRTEFRLCSPYNSVILEFIRAVVHRDYIVTKPKIYADQCALMRMEPDFAVQTTFDYSGGPVEIYGNITDPEDEDFVDAKDEWLDTIERAESSDARMALHDVILKVGTSVRSILVSLRRSDSDTEALLKLIADSEDDLASDNVAAKIRAHLEHGEKDLVEIH
ncbi:hypothetical protein B0H19DRAFT_1374489 [Mycena capillaripes]|nr:hypothetical protein B0H19DRAFT_1374489 [Mycena capillaripes]